MSSAPLLTLAALFLFFSPLLNAEIHVAVAALNRSNERPIIEFFGLVVPRISTRATDMQMLVKRYIGFNESNLFGNAPEKVIEILRRQNVTGNYHSYCVTEDDLKEVNLTDDFRVMSVNHDWNDLEFISTLEHRTFPFYGVQFHPEKNLYEWAATKNIPHNPEATIAAQYFADFFVNEARKNTHAFSSAEEEMDSLIYNYPVTYTALKSSSYTQCYMFSNTTTSD